MGLNIEEIIEKVRELRDADTHVCKHSVWQEAGEPDTTDDIHCSCHDYDEIIDELQAYSVVDAVENLGVNAFIGGVVAAPRNSGLAWRVSEDEEHMITIEDAISDVEEDDFETDESILEELQEMEAVGVTDIVVIRGW